MTWGDFRYIFDKKVENAMRYSIQEAFRHERQFGLMSSDRIVEDAIARFKRKMEKHTGETQKGV